MVSEHAELAHHSVVLWVLRDYLRGLTAGVRPSTPRVPTQPPYLGSDVAVRALASLRYVTLGE